MWEGLAVDVGHMQLAAQSGGREILALLWGPFITGAVELPAEIPHFRCCFGTCGGERVAPSLLAP